MMVRLTGFQRLSRTCRRRCRTRFVTRSSPRSVTRAWLGFLRRRRPLQGLRLLMRSAGQSEAMAARSELSPGSMNERSGATLWSSSSDYAADEASRVPRRIAVIAGRWPLWPVRGFDLSRSHCPTRCSLTICATAKIPAYIQQTLARDCRLPAVSPLLRRIFPGDGRPSCWPPPKTCIRPIRASVAKRFGASGSKPRRKLWRWTPRTAKHPHRRAS